MNAFNLKCLLKGELLNRVTRRYPNMEPDSLEVLTLLKQMAATLEQIGDRNFAENGLSEGRFYILAFLLLEEIQEHEPPLPSTIADNLGVTRATITGLLDGLERDGLIERRHSLTDRRALTICLTHKGRERIDGFVPQQTQQFAELLSPLTHEEKQTLIKLLSKINPAPKSV